MSLDLIVVGGGLIGSAAARHAAEAGLRVALVGPDEPSAAQWAQAAHHGAWFDEGRITRRLDKDPLWARLAAASLDRYADLQARSGIRFYSPSGFVTVSPPEGAYLRSVAATAAATGTAVEALSAAALREELPYMSLPADCEGLLQRADAGTVSPREMVRAQRRLAAAAGALLVRSPAVSVAPGRVETESGEALSAARVVLAAGAYTTLLPAAAALRERVVLRTQSVVRVALRGAALAALRAMPAVVVQGSGVLADGLTAYILPPIEYPDGEWYLKIGHGVGWERELRSAAEVRGWYTGAHLAAHGDTCADFLRGLLRRFFPALAAGWDPAQEVVERCVTSHSDTHYPFVGAVGPGVVVATAGNGYAAKSADEIGRLAVFGGAQELSPTPRARL